MRWLVMLLLALLVAGCAQLQPPEEAAPGQPVETPPPRDEPRPETAPRVEDANLRVVGVEWPQTQAEAAFFSTPPAAVLVEVGLRTSGAEVDAATVTNLSGAIETLEGEWADVDLELVSDAERAPSGLHDLRFRVRWLDPVASVENATSGHVWRREVPFGNATRTIPLLVEPRLRVNATIAPQGAWPVLELDARDVLDPPKPPLGRLMAQRLNETHVRLLEEPIPGHPELWFQYDARSAWAVPDGPVLSLERNAVVALPSDVRVVELLVTNGFRIETRALLVEPSTG